MSRTPQIPTSNDLEPRVLCRYDPVLGDRSNLVLRCRCDPADRTADLVRMLRIRWWCDAGRVLAWEAAPRILELPRGSEWASLSVTVPVPPRSSAFLRFELFFAIPGNAVTAGTGFVQPGPIQAAFRGSLMTLSAPRQREMRLPSPKGRCGPAAARGAIAATAVPTLPAW